MKVSIQQQNMINYLSRNGYSHMDCAGIYRISVDGRNVYIGKSVNMLHRMAQHLIEMKNPKETKYRLLAEAKAKHLRIQFSVLYYASDVHGDALDEELGKMEGIFIRQYLPPLNTQIPKEENWHSYTTHPVDEEAFRRKYIYGNV